MLRNFKMIFILVAIFVLLGSTYSFAAANTIPTTTGGYGATTVSGYTVSDIVYDLDPADPTIVDAITYTVSPDGSGVAAVVSYLQTDPAGSWTTCSLAAGTLPAMEVTCTFGALALADVTALNIVASSTTNP